MNRYPYHRYCRWLALEGESPAALAAHIYSLGFIAPRREDVEIFVRTCMGPGVLRDADGRAASAAWRAACDVAMFDDLQGDRDLEQCYWLVETAPVRALCEKLLITGLSPRQVATVLNLRANAQVREEAVRLFRDGFWDVKTLTSLDFKRYYALGNRERPEPPSHVPLTQRVAAVAWDNGLVPTDEELSTDDIVRSIQVSAYLKYAECQKQTGADATTQAQRWATTALRASALQRAKKPETRQDELPGLKPRVHYPDSPVPTLAELAALDVPPPPPETYAPDDGSLAPALGGDDDEVIGNGDGGDGDEKGGERT